MDLSIMLLYHKKHLQRILLQRKMTEKTLLLQKKVMNDGS